MTLHLLMNTCSGSYISVCFIKSKRCDLGCECECECECEWFLERLCCLKLFLPLLSPPNILLSADDDDDGDDGDGEDVEPRERIDDTESLDVGLGKRVFIGCAVLNVLLLLLLLSFPFVLVFPLGLCLLFILLLFFSVNGLSFGDDASRVFVRLENAESDELSPKALKRFILVSLN